MEMSEQSLLTNSPLQQTPRVRRLIARDREEQDGSILMTACFASRKVEVGFDCVLFFASLVALFCADEQCRMFDPPIFYWLACSAALRLIDALNLTWIVSMKHRIAPRKLCAMRVAAVIVRASVMFISSVLLFLVQYWGRSYVWDNGIQSIRDIDDGGGGAYDGGVCNSFMMQTALYGNFLMFCFQIAMFGISALLLLCYCVSYCCCCCCKSADERRVAMWLQRRQNIEGGEGVPPPVEAEAAERGTVVQRPRRWSEEAWRSLTTIVTFADLQEKREETECSICTLEFTPDCRLRTLPCRHFFHAECIDQWWTSTTAVAAEAAEAAENGGRSKEKLCPVCRAPVRVVS